MGVRQSRTPSVESESMAAVETTGKVEAGESSTHQTFLGIPFAA